MTSMQVVRRINKIAPIVPFFYLEDVYVAMCTKTLNYSLLSLRGFYSVRLNVDPCVHKSKITSHRVSPPVVRFLWKYVCKQFRN